MAKPSALARKTVLGAIWTIATGIGVRVLGLVGTLVLTRFIAPDVYGEVSAASVAVLTAHFMTSLGLGQYIVTRPEANRQAFFHATVYFLSAGSVAIGLVVLLRGPIARYVFDAPGVEQYIPGLALGAILDRLSYVPDRLLVREMQFRAVAIRNTASEVSFTVSAVGLAALGWGGNAIVAATILRALVRAVMTISAVSPREWLTPVPRSRERTREMLAFGLPLNLGSLANFGAQRWDNGVMIRLFGESAGGLYTLAWNLADIPASQVGERIGDVLVPSFAKLEPERRKAALIRALTLLTLIVVPLSVGLGAVGPTILSDTFFKASWEPAGPMLTVLAALGVTRPIGWVVSVYLQAHGRNRSIMVLEWLKVLAIVGGIAALGLAGGVLWACAGVGVGFGLHALASLWLVRRIDGISYPTLLRPLAGPILACAPMVAAILAVRYGLAGAGGLPRGARLAAEVAAGGVAFVFGALVLARRASRDFLQLARDAIRRRK